MKYDIKLINPKIIFKLNIIKIIFKINSVLPKIPFLDGENMTNKLIKPEHQTYPIVAKAKIGPSPNKLFIFL